MCHRRGDWSRTSSKVSETETEREEERPRGEKRTPWTVRAKSRLAAFISPERDSTEESPEKPAVKPETAHGEMAEKAAESKVGEETETEDEREEDPIPADD